MKLIRTTNRRVVGIRGFGGVCNHCNSPVEYDGEIIGIFVRADANTFYLVPLDEFKCPYCGERTKALEVTESMNVTNEYAQLREADK